MTDKKHSTISINSIDPEELVIWGRHFVISHTHVNLAMFW